MTAAPPETRVSATAVGRYDRADRQRTSFDHGHGESSPQRRRGQQDRPLALAQPASRRDGRRIRRGQHLDLLQRAVEHRAVHAEAPVDREQHPPQVGDVSQGRVLGILLQRLKCASALDDRDHGFRQARGIDRRGCCLTRRRDGPKRRQKGGESSLVFGEARFGQFVIYRRAMTNGREHSRVAITGLCRRRCSQGRDQGRRWDRREQRGGVQPCLGQDLPGAIEETAGGDIDDFDLDVRVAEERRPRAGKGRQKIDRRQQVEIGRAEQTRSREHHRRHIASEAIVDGLGLSFETAADGS